jgi:hypothetical protein
VSRGAEERRPRVWTGGLRGRARMNASASVPGCRELQKGTKGTREPSGGAGAQPPPGAAGRLQEGWSRVPGAATHNPQVNY